LTSGPSRSSLALIGSLARLDLLQGSISLRSPNLGLDRLLFANIIQAESDNSTGNLVDTTGALLGGGLGDTLLVEATPGLGPDELGGLFALEGEGVGFGGTEEDGLSVATDEEGSVSGVDPIF